MKKLTALAAFAATMAFATPAAASVTLTTGSGSTTLNVGGTATLNFVGVSDGSDVAGLTNTLTLTLVSQTSAQSVFSFNLANTSSSPITNSRVSVFGFDASPNVASSSMTNAIFTGTGSGSIANGRSVEWCFTAGPNCAGGAGGGVGIGTSTSGTFTLNFSGSATNLTLSNFGTRFQSLAGGRNTPNSATGRATSVTPAVPEPGTWAMMLIGFGALGVSMRRARRKQGFLPQAA